MPPFVIVPVENIIDRNYAFTGVESDTQRKQAVEACYSSFLYYDSPRKRIASIVASLIKGHFFVDGNKRTALFVYILLSELNKIKYIDNAEEQVKTFVEIAASHKTVEEYADLLFPDQTY